MKIKNLLLAGLAVFAMSSCSNEIDEVVDNGQVNDTEKSFVKFGISFPQDKVRANGDENALDIEQDFTNVAVIINGKVNNYTKADFKKQEGTNLAYLKEAIPVTAGSNNIYVVLNPTSGLALTNPTTQSFTAETYETLDALTASGYIAESNKFLMSNAGGEVVTVNIEKGNTETAIVNVERAAAKLVESSPTTVFVTERTNENKAKLNVTLNNYSFQNLEKKTNLLAGQNFVSGGFFQPYDADISTWEFSSKVIGNSENNANITYCMENSSTDATTVIYEATATWGETTASTFYITPDNTIYYNFASLNNVYGDLLKEAELSADSTPADFKAKSSIKMFKDGKCYYSAPIKTGEAEKIVRNNMYKLTVNSIADLGTPTPTPDPDATLLNLTVKINNWTFNENNFDL